MNNPEPFTAAEFRERIARIMSPNGLLAPKRTTDRRLVSQPGDKGYYPTQQPQKKGKDQ